MRLYKFLSVTRDSAFNFKFVIICLTIELTAKAVKLVPEAEKIILNYVAFEY